MPQPLIIVGCGGHAKVVADAARSSGDWTVAAFTVDEPDIDTFEGASVIALSDAISRSDHLFVLAVGENIARKNHANLNY